MIRLSCHWEFIVLRPLSWKSISDTQSTASPYSKPKINLCLFDLDQTLLRTDHLEDLRGTNYVDMTCPIYVDALKNQISYINDPYIYTTEHLATLRNRFTNVQWGVFTRAPRQYTKTILKEAYPTISWDTIVSYEDVKRTKPAGYGIGIAMDACGIANSNQVLLIGDSWHDIQAGYHGECWTALNKFSWEQPHSNIHFPAKELIPDAIVDSPSKLQEYLADPEAALVELEYSLANDDYSRSTPRFDRIEHFAPDKKTKVTVTVMGRYFTGNSYNHPLGSNHQLTQQIRQHKNARQFPIAWIKAIRTYLFHTCKGANPIVTVIPFKHQRVPRLEALLEQVQLSDRLDPIRPGTEFRFIPDVLSHKSDANSFHKSSVGKYQRFQQSDANLYITSPNEIQGQQIIVFDDVVTTGASLLTAHRKLKNTGATKVACMALAKTISRIKQ